MQADIAIAPSDRNRIYATVANPQTVGIYRSDDAGESWTQITTDTRPAGRIGGGDLPVPAVDPKNSGHRDHREHGQLSIDRRRQDLDRAARRARRRRLPAAVDQPGQPEHHRDGERPGRDHHRQRRRDLELLVQPADRRRCITSTPTTRFPYRVCGGQQESGSACVSSRGNDGMITFREWHPVGVEEYGYVAPDPLEPRHRLRRQGDALQPQDRPGAERRADAGAPGRLPDAAHRAGRLLHRRSARPVLRVEHALEDGDRRPELDSRSART